MPTSLEKITLIGETMMSAKSVFIYGYLKTLKRKRFANFAGNTGTVLVSSGQN